MWLALMTFTAASGSRFVIPFPIPILWPLVVVLALAYGLLALVTFSRRRWAAMRVALFCLIHLGGASVSVSSRDGAAFELRLV